MVRYPLEFFLIKTFSQIKHVKGVTSSTKWFDLLGTVKSFELAAILDWYDVNLGNIVFQFYLKANSPHKTYVVRSPKNSNWIWANVRQTLWKEITKQLLKKTVFDWRNVEKKKGKKYWLSPFGYVHPEAIHLLITKT